METTINDGVAVIAIEFEADADADKKYDEVTREVNALRPDLPQDIAQLEIRKIAPSLVNIVEIALVSEDAPYRELEDHARELKDALKTVHGVRTAETWAYPERELRVEVDLKRMAELAITPGQVIQALQSENANIPAGLIDLGPRSFSLKTSGAYTSLDEVRDTVVASVGGRSVRVRDVARVSWETQPWSYVARFNGKRAVIVTANQKDGYNILEVSEQLKDSHRPLRAGPAEAHHACTWGSTSRATCSERLSRLYTDFGIAIALVLAHAAAARLARGEHRDGLDPAVARVRADGALLPRLLAQPDLHCGIRRRAGTAGGRFHRRGREHLATSARRAIRASMPRSRARSRSSWRSSAARPR